MVCHSCGKRLTHIEKAVNSFYDVCSVCGETTFVVKSEVFGLNFFENSKGEIFFTTSDRLWEISEDKELPKVDEEIVSYRNDEGTQDE